VSAATAPWPPAMHRYPAYTRERLAQTVDRLRKLVYADRRALDTLLVAGPTDRIPRARASRLEYRPCAIGDRFGPLWATYWFRLGAGVPSDWAGSRVDLLWETGTESTLWIDGSPVQGLVTGDGRERPVAPITATARGGEVIAFEVELACNGQFGAPPGGRDESPPATLERAEVARFDAAAWELLHDFRVLQELEAEVQNGLDPGWAGELLAELNRFCNVWDAEDRGSWPEAQAILRRLLEQRNGSRGHRVFALGHGHLDTAWLWPLAETYRKCQRTFSTQLALMREYPEHRFACSSAQHYAWIKERDPELYDDMRARVREGRWVPVGGSWIEPDCNLPSGESLARQLLHGQRFFQREFGRRCQEFWNPDVFGYPNQLPQLMRGAGMTRFLTQKLSWNRFTSLPFHTFAWEGLDGSRVITHFPPTDTYEAQATVAEMRRGAAAYRDHDRSRHSLLLYGHGDGGGGPTPEMLETLRRTGDLQGVPPTAIATSDDFFAALEDDVTELPVVVGELYLEYHRGTYTTQAAIKRGNRRCEAALHDAELLAAVASRVAGHPYPAGELAELWRVLLVNQFHDILPGSSIGHVNAEAVEQLTTVARRAHELASAAGFALARGGGTDQRIAFNTTDRPRAEVAETPDGDLAFVQAPACGWGRRSTAPDRVIVEPHDDGWILANDQFVARMAADGSLTSLVLRAGDREALAGAANRFELYEDRPVRYDAWDIDPFHLETGRPCAGARAARIGLADPLRGELVFEHQIGRTSRIVQTVRLDAGARRLEFHTDVDWHERHRMLKVAFPLRVRAERATYETPFGNAERPTHYTTPADLARFEVPGQRWADVSEHGFGIALINDGKYGHSCHGNVLRLSLLRAPTHPDPDADQGHHQFTYALMPHLGGWRQAGVAAEARRFNQPLVWATGSASSGSFASLDDPNLVLDTIKRAEDSEALVLRLYEAHGARGVAQLRVGLPFRAAHFANLLEDSGDAAAVAGDTITVPFEPFQIVTLLLG
jgi:alpha-mannosidase